MKRKRFFLEPEDFLYFGPPHGAAAGESHHGVSLFPPPLSAWQGMVRTRLLLESSLDLRDRSPINRQRISKLVGESDSLPKSWQLGAPIPARRMDTKQGAELQGYFQTPLWVHRVKDGSQNDLTTIHPLPKTAVGGLGSDLNQEGQLWPWPVGNPKAGRTSPAGGWIDDEGLLLALKGGIPQAEPTDMPPGFEWEMRPGLGIDSASGQNRQSMLYFLRTIRCENGCGFSGWLSASLPSDLKMASLHRGIVGAGKKARPLHFSRAPQRSRAWSDIDSGSYLPAKVKDGFCFWIYLASPAQLKENRHPPLNMGSGDERIEILAPLLKKPQWFGGFSMATGRSKSNRAYVPAGSAYLCRIWGSDEKGRAERLKAIHNQSLFTQHDPSRAAFGEGLIYIGLLPAGRNL